MKKQLVSVMAVTLLAQLAAFVKLWLTARLFGVGPELDGYNLGFVLPTLVAGILSGMLQTGLFPVYAQLRAEGNTRRLEQFERLVLLAMGVLAGIIALVLAVGASNVAELLAHDSTDAVRQWTAFVLPWAAAAILLNGIGDYLGYVLALRGRYVIAASAPIANAILGAALLAAWPEGGLLNLTLGTVAGIALQVMICLAGAQWAGFRPFGVTLAVGEFKSEFAQMLRLGGWILPGLVFANLTASLPTILVAQYGEGAVSAFGYAYRLHQSAIQLLVMAASPVILAHFSDLVARGEWESLRVLLRKAGWISLTIGFVAWAGVFLLGEPVLAIVFGHGRFDAEAVNRVASQWAWLTLGLAPAILGNVLAKCLQALARPRLISVLAAVGLLVLLGLAAVFSGLLSESAVPAALSGSALFVTLLLWKSVLLRTGSQPVDRLKINERN